MRGEKGTSTVSGYRSQGTQLFCFHAPAIAERMVLALAPGPEQNRAIICRAESPRARSLPIASPSHIAAYFLNDLFHHDCLSGELVLSRFS
jgi:hypothetical protein